MVNLTEDGAVGRFSEFGNRYLDPALGLHTTADKTTRVDIGFFYVEGSGTPNAELEKFECRSCDFFALPFSKNRELDCALSPIGQGIGPPNKARGGR